MHAVDLAALHQMHVPERPALGRAQHVVEQREVRRRVLERLLLVGRPAAVEQVGGVLVAGERAPALLGSARSAETCSTPAIGLFGGLRDRPVTVQSPDDASSRAMALPTAPVTPAMTAFIAPELSRSSRRPKRS